MQPVKMERLRRRLAPVLLFMLHGRDEKDAPMRRSGARTVQTSMEATENVGKGPFPRVGIGAWP
jgi:hypothetical protein